MGSWHVGLTGRGTRAAAAALVIATVALVTGCGGQQAGRGDGKAPTVLPHSTPQFHRSSPLLEVPLVPRARTSAPPAPGQTSTPDPQLPPPVVSMDIAYAAEGGGKAVNVTIDDGPDPDWTPQVLKLLTRYRAKATFCLIGPQATAHPGLVRRIVAEGHRLCDHSVSHDTAMNHRPAAYQRQQIVEAAEQITRASGGVKPLYYRAPGGAFTPYSRQVAAAAGMRPLGWSADSKDFEKPGTEAIVSTVRDELDNGPTLLFHDGGGDRHQTVGALRKLLPWLSRHGYRFSFPVR